MPNEAKRVFFVLEPSQPGKFIEFTTDYRQSNYQGFLLKPLISQIDTFFQRLSRCGENIPLSANPLAGDNMPGSALDANWLQQQQVYVGGPVDVATGNYVYSMRDITLPGRGQPLDFRHIYSRDRLGWLEDNVLGPGWTHNFNIRLFFDKREPESQAYSGPQSYAGIVYQDANGNRLKFSGPYFNKSLPPLDLFCSTLQKWVPYSTESGWLCPQEGLLASLTFEKTGVSPDNEAIYQYTVILHDGTRYLFDTYGYVTRIDRVGNNNGGADAPWHPLTLEYTTPDSSQPGYERLTKVSDASGRYLEFQYDNGGWIHEVHDQRGGSAQGQPYVRFDYGLYA